MPKILVIEDEALVRANILEILDSSGDFDALGAENGLVGVRLAREHRPDLIVCDIMMPELDGYGVLEALRADPATAAIPFIFLTAKADQGDLRFGMNLGADDYLTKPFRRTELLVAISTRLQKQTAVANRYSIELKQAEERLNYLLHYDSLTHLPNLQLLRNRLRELMAKATRHQQSLPVLSLDLDRFNRLNQTLGYEVGDGLLKAVAHRLGVCVALGDTVARLRADQFAIVLAGGEHSRDAAETCATILNAFCEPFLLNGHEVFVTASIGISLYPHDGSDTDTLLQNADLALSHARQLGGNQYQFYTPQMNGIVSRMLALEASLRYALELGQFQVYYQPQVHLQSGEIVGAEALLRWQHPEWGFVSPAEFIPLAEQTGLILLIDHWVLETACAQIVAWNRAGLPPVRIAVNLSGRQFQQPNFSERVLEILLGAGADSHYLELELTERIIIQTVQKNVEILKALKGHGIQIAVDDFGTGYSSLNYLKTFPFDIIKIDGCFVRHIDRDSKNAAITSAIIQMAHSLNLKVIAEGVETEAELAVLRQYGCDAMQGYLFSRPVPAAEFERMLQSGKRLPV
ncbi:putative bifunctional diguanylate cyclase/phosphodiesterase [Kamptonema formosum]|uniref:putative bifunctional diguanylate cyclase/phosphodiesterase n=1 Tax=Kamptonema formosum TaxID=331992 RepID=UPI000360C6A3|nr:EAL domain-containing protein [Oscillatoria sp. PCC 10802]